MIPAGTGHADHCCLEYDKHWLEHLDARSHIDNLKDLFLMILFLLVLCDFQALNRLSLLCIIYTIAVLTKWLAFYI